MKQLAILVILLALMGPLSVAAEGVQNDDDPTPTPTATIALATAFVTTATPSPTATSAPPAATATVTPTATPSPLDGYEPDDVPSAAKRIVIQEIQIRSYWRPAGNDEDWAVVYLKPGRWQIAARTTTAIYDPRLTVEGQTADDTGNSKDAVLNFVVTDERDYLIFIENVGLDGWGEYTLTVTRLSDLFTPTPYPTYTPLATYTAVPPTPVVYPTYTPYPTYVPYPTLTAVATSPSGSGATPTPQPTYTPYPTYAPYPTPSAPMSYPTPALPYGSTGNSGPAPYSAGSSTGSSGVSTGDKGAAGSGDGSAGAAAPLPPTQSAAKVSLQIFIDSNRNGVMDYGEEVESVLVYATTRDRRFEMEGYTSKGEAVLPLSEMTEDEELLLLVPYLHRAASFQQRGGTITSDVALDLPQFPVYLP